MNDFILTSSNTDLSQLTKNASDDNQAVLDYFKLNRLAIQSSKTKLRLIRHSKSVGDPIKIEIDDTDIHQKQSVKVLGVELDNRLNFVVTW